MVEVLVRVRVLSTKQEQNANSRVLNYCNKCDVWVLGVRSTTVPVTLGLEVPVDTRHTFTSEDQACLLSTVIMFAAGRIPWTFCGTLYL